MSFIPKEKNANVPLNPDSFNNYYYQISDVNSTVTIDILEEFEKLFFDYHKSEQANLVFVLSIEQSEYFKLFSKLNYEFWKKIKNNDSEEWFYTKTPLPKGGNATSGINAFVYKKNQNDLQILLVKEKKGPKVFKNITGFMEKGENPFQSLKREIKEEVGIDIEERKTNYLNTFWISENGINDTDEVIFTFAVEVPSDSVVTIQTSEIVDAQWFTIENLNAPNVSNFTKRIFKSFDGKNYFEKLKSKNFVEEPDPRNVKRQMFTFF